MKKSQPLKLQIELVPATTWFDNMRSVVPLEKWNKIRNYVYAQFQHRCAICKSAGQLHCHEVWNYNDKLHIQKLKGFVALCEMCHHVKHIGLASLMASQGKVDYDEVIAHFMKVNNCDRLTFIKHKQQAFKLWEERSKHDWVIDVGGYEFSFLSKNGIIRAII